MKTNSTAAGTHTDMPWCPETEKPYSTWVEIKLFDLT